MPISLGFDDSGKAQAKALEGVSPLVEKMCDHLLRRKLHYLDQFATEHRVLLPKYNIDDGGFRRLAVERADFERLLRPWKRELGLLMLQVPRNKDETLTDYHKRLEQSDGDRWGSRFDRMSDWLAHIHRIEEEERAARQLELAAEEERQREEKERRREERRELERQATVDPKEIKRLLAVIAEAKDIEDLMALIDRANAARMALRDIYMKEREACAYLGKPVPEREVPEGASKSSCTTTLPSASQSGANAPRLGADACQPQSK